MKSLKNTMEFIQSSIEQNKEFVEQNLTLPTAATKISESQANVIRSEIYNLVGNKKYTRLIKSHGYEEHFGIFEYEPTPMYLYFKLDNKVLTKLQMWYNYNTEVVILLKETGHIAIHIYSEKISNTYNIFKNVYIPKLIEILNKEIEAKKIEVDDENNLLALAKSF